ncbi:dephospho-CoA kinase [Niabella terrae]
MLKIGLTGGIGSGKTTIAKIFSTLGVPVYDADSAAKRLMREDRDIRRKIISVFGAQAYKDEAPDRAFLAAAVFSDPEQLEQLNQILHPATIQDSVSWFEQLQAPYGLKEAAIIFETGSEIHLDDVIGVWAPEALRIQRTMQRSALTEAEVRSRMARQMDESEKMQRCRYIIENDGLRPVIPQVVQLHEQLLARAAELT